MTAPLSTSTPGAQPLPPPIGPTVNITPMERVGRVIVGLAAAIVGVVLLSGAGSTVAVVLELLLVAAGLDLIVTGARGYCPLYNRLGYVPPSLRGSR